MITILNRNTDTLMKRLLLTLFALVTVFTVQAEDYTYLTFETSGGSKVSVPIASLTISISGETLTAGSETFILSDLTRMYFSTNDETTGITTLTADDLNEATAIYDLQGKIIPKEQMQKGVYIVKTKNGTFKLTSK